MSPIERRVLEDAWVFTAFIGFLGIGIFIGFVVGRLSAYRENTSGEEETEDD